MVNFTISGWGTALSLAGELPYPLLGKCPCYRWQVTDKTRHMTHDRFFLLAFFSSSFYLLGDLFLLLVLLSADTERFSVSCIQDFCGLKSDFHWIGPRPSRHVRLSVCVRNCKTPTFRCPGDFWLKNVFLILAYNDTIFKKNVVWLFSEIVKTRGFESPPPSQKKTHPL